MSKQNALHYANPSNNKITLFITHPLDALIYVDINTYITSTKKRSLTIVTQVNVFIREISNMYIFISLTAITPFSHVTTKVSRQRKTVPASEYNFTDNE